MRTLTFTFENELIIANVITNQISIHLIEYTVLIEKDTIKEALGYPIYFKLNRDIFGFSQLNERTNSKYALSFLFAFKQALDWAIDVQPNID